MTRKGGSKYEVHQGDACIYCTYIMRMYPFFIQGGHTLMDVKKEDHPLLCGLARLCLKLWCLNPASFLGWRWRCEMEGDRSVITVANPNFEKGIWICRGDRGFKHQSKYQEQSYVYIYII